MNSSILLLWCLRCKYHWFFKICWLWLLFGYNNIIPFLCGYETWECIPSSNPPNIWEVMNLGIFFYKGGFMIKTAILVDGAFYWKRAFTLFGDVSPAERAKELSSYCHRHIKDEKEGASLYRVFYYDCPPMNKQIYHPLLKRTINLGKSDDFVWANEFFKEVFSHSCWTTLAYWGSFRPFCQHWQNDIDWCLRIAPVQLLYKTI